MLADQEPITWDLPVVFCAAGRKAEEAMNNGTASA